MERIFDILLAAVVSSGVVSVVLSFLLKRRTEEITNELKKQFEVGITKFRSTYTWKERSLAELLGPIYMQFGRTKDAFRRYNQANLYLEAKVLKTGNETIRNLLLDKTHLIPSDLLPDARKLVEHYDKWLEEFEKLRSEPGKIQNDKFVFVGPQGFPFPREAEEKFIKRFKEMWQEMYGSENND